MRFSHVHHKGGKEKMKNNLNKGLKKKITTVLACILVVNPLLTKAADHTHQFSFWCDDRYYSSTVDHHRYYEKGSYKNCDVVGDYYREVLRCGCGKEKYGKYWIVTRHMQCGQ